MSTSQDHHRDRKFKSGAQRRNRKQSAYISENWKQ